ncbi:MAG: tRNA lysidine(34) synthetase TilS [Porticoccaceae bacterium]
MASPSDEIRIPPSALLGDAKRLIIAFSGGLDSTVLLHAAAAQLPRHKLRAVHVNHGISPNSDHWQLHCEAVCRALGIPCDSFRVVVSASGKGLEEAAREARYRCFTALAGRGDLLLMAHHQDDQMETVLLRLLRGAGPKGLAGMPESRQLGAGHLYRPFLHYRRDQLEAQAHALRLSWVEDESNEGIAYDRNYLRREVLPALATRWPDYRQRLARSAAQCASADAALREQAAEDLAALAPRGERVGASFELAGFTALSGPRQEQLLRHWVETLALAPLPHRLPATLARDLLAARQDAAPQVAWPGGEFRRYRGRLYVLPLQGESRSESLAVTDITAPLSLPDGSTLRFVQGRGAAAFRFRPAQRLEVRFREGGERCQPAARSASAPLKKILQEYALEPWLRERLPLIYIDGELAAAGDLFVCTGFACGPDEEGFVPHWGSG